MTYLPLPSGCKATYYDPYHLDGYAYKYGSLRDIHLHAIVGEHILWGCTYTDTEGVEHTTGGFSGPFEALAHVLRVCEEKR